MTMGASEAAIRGESPAGSSPLARSRSPLDWSQLDGEPLGLRPAALEALRADLARFTVDSVEQLLGPMAAKALGREESVPAVLACRRSTGPLAALIEAFVLGCPVARRRLDGALPSLGVGGAESLGLIEAAGASPDDPVRALVDLRPHAVLHGGDEATWWIASDLSGLATGQPLRPDHVLGVGGASLTLARLAIRSPAARVLDVGTGCGIQALHAAAHAERVVATDISPRALSFAAFNWALNIGDRSRLELRLGSLYQPVTGELFDRIVSNPPFVITPRSLAGEHYTYRDGGLVGDAIVRAMVIGAAEALAPGGVAQFLGNWEIRAEQPWADRVGSWLDAIREETGLAEGLDAWVIQREVQDPAEYAETWLRDAGEVSGSDYRDRYAAWLADFAERGVQGVGFGLVTLRRPGGERASAEGARASAEAAAAPSSGRWRRLEEVRGGTQEPLGDHIAAVLAAQQRLAAMGDDELLASRWVVAGDVTQERHYRPGAADPEVVLLRQGGGFGRALQVSGEVAAAVGACDGELALGQIGAAVAALLELPTADVQRELAVVGRALVLDGLLLPVESG